MTALEQALEKAHALVDALEEAHADAAVDDRVLVDAHVAYAVTLGKANDALFEALEEAHADDRTHALEQAIERARAYSIAIERAVPAHARALVAGPGDYDGHALPVHHARVACDYDYAGAIEKANNDYAVAIKKANNDYAVAINTAAKEFTP